MATRRERQRAATIRDLTRAALGEIQRAGPASVSLRAVARAIGMSPAGVYRYFDSRDALLTALIADSYDDLADHLCVATGRPPKGAAMPDRPDPGPPVRVAADADPAARARAAALAYRDWAVARPHEFALLFGDPIPGYTAPPGGPTVAAMQRVGEALGRPLIDAARAGCLRTAPIADNSELRGALAPMDGLDAAPLGPELAATLLLVWGRLHGQVSLEVFGHHRWLFPGGCAALYEAEVDWLLADLGLTGPDGVSTRRP